MRPSIHSGPIPNAKCDGYCYGTGPAGGEYAGKVVRAVLHRWPDSTGSTCRTMVITIDGKRLGAWDYLPGELQQARDQFDRLAFGLIPIAD